MQMGDTDRKLTKGFLMTKSRFQTERQFYVRISVRTRSHQMICTEGASSETLDKFSQLIWQITAYVFCLSVCGCAPVKAGGMRIVQKHQPTPAPEPPQKDDSEEYISSSPPRAPVIVSGVVTKGDKDFTPAAAQVAHNKPLPGVPKLPPAQHINQHIHQPRK
ncbi:death-associated protein 1 isoform X1 [Neolamprologus brichardi]|uniref:death-associated protein 1 isoform X1 n=1 Tax=Neolamprologus brichardi TaxID=32507 RepID=UPI0016438B06|nr:death-associated protein 1 isoform X1 [Neolamprologus brichardi]XP_035765317.1 death-associated protein 1 isoform X1 [Neolamprologus brichardi]